MLILVFLHKDLLLRSGNENLCIGTHHTTEEEDVAVLAEVETMKDTHEETEEGGNKEDWDEVSGTPAFPFETDSRRKEETKP